MYISIVVSLTVDNGWKYGRSLKYYDTFTIQYTEYQCVSTCSLRLQFDAMWCQYLFNHFPFGLWGCLPGDWAFALSFSLCGWMDGCSVLSVFLFCQSFGIFIDGSSSSSLLAFFLSLFIYISLAIDVHTDMIAVGIAAQNSKSKFVCKHYTISFCFVSFRFDSNPIRRDINQTSIIS